MKSMPILLAGAALLVACTPSVPPPEVAAPMIDPANPLFAPGYMAQAASGDLFEIQSSQLALQMASSPAVRSFASMLIADHSRMTQTMTAAAQAAGLMPPPAVLLPEHQALLDQLRAAGSGPAFEMAFRNAQVTAHQQALALHQDYAARGDHPGLRMVASQAVPIIQAHLGQAQGLSVAPPPPVIQTVPTGERG